ncbi:OLC1v1005558C1 [Oldenlandia corymbosa var. corymbosa]|uniref:OLC1v1005558C1 n=1 Tax=Oldenlandia corymbosa var. corymbosa TaxID=529605 RepID=A0AAV1DEY0_OLDCO|nr:OLC1v1005558C1 [Oldenlandia corymbosa var. corymbosa]
MQFQGSIYRCCLLLFIGINLCIASGLSHSNQTQVKSNKGQGRVVDMSYCVNSHQQPGFNHPWVMNRYKKPIYSLSRFYPYNHRMTTEKGVTYYVKTEKFVQEYPPKSKERVAIENRVDYEYYTMLSRHCMIQLQILRLGYKRETPVCNALKQFDARATGLMVT